MTRNRGKVLMAGETLPDWARPGRCLWPRLVMTVLLMFVVSACSAYELGATATARPPGALATPSAASESPVPTATPVTAKLPTATPEISAYENDMYGFRLQLPTRYRLVDLPRRAGILLAMGLSPANDEHRPHDGYPIGLTVYDKSPDTPLVDWFAQHVGGLTGSGEPTAAEAYFYDPLIQNQRDWKGLPALQYLSGNRPVPFETLIDRGAWVIGLYYLSDYPLDNAQLYEELLASLDFFELSTPVNSTATPLVPSATPTVCLDGQATPRALAPRQTPLDVHFVSDGNVWAWNDAQEAALQITATGDARSFSFSPDGQVIAFTRGPQYGQAELWGIRRDGTALQRLLSAEQLHELVGPPTTSEFAFTDGVAYQGWLANTHRLTFEVQRNYDALGGCCESGGFWQVDLDTGQWSPWTPPPDVTNEIMRLPSPDGSQVALINASTVTFTNADGSNVREAGFSFTTDIAVEGGGIIYPHFEWTNDSQALLAVTFSPDIFSDKATFTTWRIPLDSSPAEALYTFAAPSYWVSLSPNQAYLAYKRRIRPMTNDYELHLATLDGSRDVTYQSQYALEFVGWHPDGYHFVYGQWNVARPFLGSVCGGGGPLLATADTPARQIQWVDGTRFLFVKGSLDPRAGPRELRLGQIGGASLLIGPFNGDQAHFTFNIEAAALGHE